MMIISFFILILFASKANFQDIRQVGTDVRSYFQYAGPLPGSRKAFLVHNTFQQRASLFGFVSVFRNTNPVLYQIWRATGVTPTNFRLVFSHRYVPASSQLNTRVEVYLRNSNCFLVEPSDRLAFMNERDPGPLGYSFINTGLDVLFYSLTNDSIPTLGETREFDDLNLPYSFALAASVDADLSWYTTNGATTCRPGLMIPPEPTLPPTPPTTTPNLKGEKGDVGLQGPKGDSGSVGAKGEPGMNGAKGDTGSIGPKGSQGDPGRSGTDGARGPKGDTGLPGIVGPSGPKGDTGNQGPVGPSGAPGLSVSGVAGSGSCTCGVGLLDPNLILGVLVWLVILTILTIVLIALMTKRQRDLDAASLYHHDNTSYRSGPTFSGHHGTEGPWIQGLREDQWKEYQVETISNR